jgi:hypothetical protein
MSRQAIADAKAKAARAAREEQMIELRGAAVLRSITQPTAFADARKAKMAAIRKAKRDAYFQKHGQA